MANKPVWGYMNCPYCKTKVPLIWDGNEKKRCPVCSKQFKTKRQKMKVFKHLKKE